MVCSDEDDTAEVLKELQRIMRERAEEQAQKVCCVIVWLSDWNEVAGHSMIMYAMNWCWTSLFHYWYWCAVMRMTLLSYWRSYKGLREKGQRNRHRRCVVCLYVSLCQCVVCDCCVTSFVRRRRGKWRRREFVQKICLRGILFWMPRRPLRLNEGKSVGWD